ncbi:hypothetical protein IEQ34_019769 [Dendrobium chrysotoxum]|uniref:Uncharacterized protein n=1 Tax=Dendrobium chrysotoxum TaxID=161865 RepID=A0AAV7G8K3_DENCH|nr:hypothetical protein IEQ34_019769 [Dendrobium chrysotoxum]
MLLPNKNHLLDRRILRLRKEEEDEYCHYDNQTTKKVKESELQVAQHVEEQLSKYESAEHVH